MDKLFSSVKCDQCGLVSFLSDDRCKRCGSALAESNSRIEQQKQTPAKSMRTTKRIALGVAIMLTLLLGSVLVLHFAGKTTGEFRSKPLSIPAEQSTASATLRASFILELKPITDGLATDLFRICRETEERRIRKESERLEQIVTENERDFTKSKADQVRTLFRLEPEARQLEGDLSRLKELSPSVIRPQLVGPDSDILFYNVTGGQARNVSQQLVEWWHAGSAGQQKMADDLRRLGFKTVIVGNSTIDGTYLELQ